MSFDGHKRDWEAMAEIDPLWAILTDSEKRGGGWTPEEFFAQGELEIAEMLDAAASVGGPTSGASSLDFGCGAGRLTRALGDRFDESVGVDISQGMIDVASRLNTDRPGLSFVVNARSDLELFEADAFDLVYSSLVLQHQPSTEIIASYLREFVRVTRPGGLIVFQLPSHMPLRYRFQPKRRAYAALRHVGVSDRFLVERTPLTPMRMLAMDVDEVRARLSECGGSVLRIESDDPTSARYFVRSASTRG